MRLAYMQARPVAALGSPNACRGCTTVLILVIFYSAPLSALAEVFRTRSSATLYLPFAAMNTVNGLLWTAYGMALGDTFIYGPNLVSLLNRIHCPKACLHAEYYGYADT